MPAQAAGAVGKVCYYWARGMLACAQGLRDWPAFKECRKIIEEFLEQLPLFQMLAHRAVRPRHWQDIARLTGAP